MVFSFIVFSSCLLQKHIKKEDNLECEDCVRIMCKDNKVRTKEPNQTSHMTHFTCSGIVGVSGHLDRAKNTLYLEDSFVGIGNKSGKKEVQR